MVRQITLDEVKKHKKGDSLWMVIHDNVYDVTSFLKEHPGGEDVLLENAGSDATQGFEDVGHSSDARELLKKYKIGVLSGGPKKTGKCCGKDIEKEIRLSESRKRFRDNVCDDGSCLVPSRSPVPTAKPWRTFDTDELDKSRSKEDSRARRSRRRTLPRNCCKTCRDVDVQVTPPSSPIPQKPRRILRCRNTASDAQAPRPCKDYSHLKYAVIALAGALVIGYIIKRQMAA